MAATTKAATPAVVAVAVRAETTNAQAWHGVPVFSAWVTEPMEPDVTGWDQRWRA
jgi:hypothetical protein